MPPLRAAAAAAAVFCAAERLQPVAAGPGILERLIEPMAPEEFLASVYENDWAYFPHNESLLPISLTQVSEWISSQGDGESVVEVLPHAVTHRKYRPPPSAGALERVQGAFLQGFSMVINSLHRWSEPGLRLAQELYAAMDLPVDVYMYLTPPHSLSYGLHNDVMDAWMVQLQGSKRWKICGRNPAPWNGGHAAKGEMNSSCPEVTMRGGDVMYLPFYTLHKAITTDELSMHLTVNIERQYYVWATLLIAVLHKAANAALKVERFLGSGELRMEGESALEVFLMRLLRKEPRLLRMPLGSSRTEASRWLARPLCRDDLPDGYLEAVLHEFRGIASAVSDAVASSKKLKRTEVRLGSLGLSGEKVAKLLLEERAVAAVPWALEVARLHAVQHFGSDDLQRFLPVPELFSTLAAARSGVEAAAKADSGASVRGLGQALSSATRLGRRREARAVLLLEDRTADGRAPAKLHVNSQVLEVTDEQLPAAKFCLGLFAASSASGRPFRADQVPGGLEASRPLLQRLLVAGALSILPLEASPEAAAAGN